MKSILKLVSIVAVALFALSSCNCFTKMGKNKDDVTITCTPEVLTLNNGVVAADLDVTFPPKYFNKNSMVRITPVLVFDGGEVAAPAKILQGSAVNDNYPVVNENNTHFTTHVEFPYDPRMENCVLQVRVEAKCPNNDCSPCRQFTYVNANTGALPTDEEREILAANGNEARLLKSKFGLNLARGLNTLQNDLDYAASMQPEADNYKHVVTHTTKADIAYKINSSTVDSKAGDTEALKALSGKVFEYKDNNRVSQTVYVNGYASPDGPEKLNDNLSSARSESGKKVVEKMLADAGVQIDAAAYGEDWEGFKEAVADSDIADKNLILQVLDMYDSASQREAEIKNMSSVYNTLKTDVLPQLRRAQVVNSADVSGKTDDEMVELVNKGKLSELDVEEALHIAEARPEVAVPVLEYAAKKYNDPRVYNNLGVAYMKAGDNAKALEAFENAAKAGGKSEALNNNLALAYAANSNAEKAQEYAAAADSKTKALLDAAKGDYAQASNELTGMNAAIANYMNGNLDAAKKALADDNSARADYMRAVIETKAGNLSTAKTQLDSAVAKDPSLAKKAAKDINLEALFN